MQQRFCPSDHARTVHIFHQPWTVTWSGILVLLSLGKVGEFYSWNLLRALFDSFDAGVKASEFCGGEHRRGAGASRGLGRWRRSRVHQEAVWKRSGYRSVHLGFPLLLPMQHLSMAFCFCCLIFYIWNMTSYICFIFELGPLTLYPPLITVPSWFCWLSCQNLVWMSALCQNLVWMSALWHLGFAWRTLSDPNLS